MKKLIITVLTLALCAGLTAPAFAYNYDFASGADSKTAFGGATSANEPVSADPMTANTRRNKDNAALPPPYGIFGGSIDTDSASPLYDNTRESGFVVSGQQLPPNGGEDYALRAAVT